MDIVLTDHMKGMVSAPYLELLTPYKDSNGPPKLPEMLN